MANPIGGGTAAGVSGLAAGAASATPYGAIASAVGQIGAAAVADAPTVQNPISGSSGSPFTINIATGHSSASSSSLWIVIAGLGIFAMLLSYLIHR